MTKTNWTDFNGLRRTGELLDQVTTTDPAKGEVVVYLYREPKTFDGVTKDSITLEMWVGGKGGNGWRMASLEEGQQRMAKIREHYGVK